MQRRLKVLAIDVGNTRAKFGVFLVGPGNSIEPIDIVARVLDQTPDLGGDLAVWWLNHGSPDPARTMLAGSDPETRDLLLSRWPFKESPPTVVAGYQQIPIGVDVDVPANVGIDRLLNVFAAGCLQKQPRAVIVVDSGTATTVDLMTEDQTFRGGSILPGLRLSAFALHDYTARLPLLDVDDAPAALPDAPGRNTEDAMRAGLMIGQLGAVRELVERLSHAAMNRIQQSVQPEVIVTGGGGRQLVQHIADAKYIDSLALHGLALLAGKVAGR